MIREYINYLVSIRGYAENTAISYGKDLRQFVAWLTINKPDARWSTVTRDDLDKYVSSCVERGLKPATTNRHLAAISGLYRYMKRQGYEIENPCKYESRRKRGKQLPNTIPVEDIKKAYDNSQGVAKILIGLLSTTGMRIQEVLDMKYEDIDFETGKIRIHGKGNKDREVYTTTDKLETLRVAASINGGSGKVFTIDQRDARHLVWEALKPYSQAAQLSPHAIRHTVATHMALMGANVSSIQTVLGHDDIRTTQKYIDMTQGNTRQLYTQYSLFN